MQPHNPKTIETIKRDYVARLGTLETLAKKYCVPLRTVRRYSSLQGWHDLRNDIGFDVALIARERAKQSARETSKRAKDFVEASINDAEMLAAYVRRLVARDEPKAPDFRHVVAAWQGVIETGRHAFNLDQPSAPSHPVMIVNNLRSELDVMPSGHVIEAESTPVNGDQPAD